MKPFALLFLMVAACCELVFSEQLPSMTQCNEGFARSQAIQEIEYLRRAYAKATDLLGTGDASAVNQGREIYRRIFSEGARLSPGVEPFSEKGPDAWARVVAETLGPLGPTQHLIGTQLVDISELQLDGQCRVMSGRAHMESYVQAWHEMPTAKIWLLLGTYIDEVSYMPGIGWRITAMNLRQVTEETRPKDG